MLKRHIETLIRDQGERRPFPLEPALRGLSHVYGKAVRMRNRQYDRGEKTIRTLPCPVISVGNITVGGTGKTPMTLYLARELVQRGYSPMIVSRGYGGTASKKGGVVCDGKTVLMDSREAGDEPYMMAVELETVPVVVGQSRFDIAMKGMDLFSPDVIVMDDGFQHRKLGRDVDILLFDATFPLGNGYLLPRGPLREPVDGIVRGDVFVLTRAQGVSDAEKTFISLIRGLGLGNFVSDTPVITSAHQPAIRGWIKAGTRDIVSPPSVIKGQSDKVIAFSGIAHNKDFRESLAGLGFKMDGFLDFPDHHPYCRGDMGAIFRKASMTPGSLLVTTQKDASRLNPMLPFPLDLWIVGIDLSILSGAPLFWDIIQTKINEKN